MIAPTLLVGLGGTGSKIVCRVSQMVTEEQRKRIGFAVFDTDINELREIREANPFIKTIQTSTKLTVGEYLNIDTHARHRLSHRISTETGILYLHCRIWTRRIRDVRKEKFTGHLHLELSVIWFAIVRFQKENIYID